MLINYNFHYSRWHNESTREGDVLYAENYLDRHALFPKSKDCNILDIGCATGNFILALNKRGYTECSGIEVDDELLRICYERGLNVIKGKVPDALAGVSVQYDAVYLFDVLEHVDRVEQLKLLRLIFDRLKDNGLLAISVPNALTPMAMYHRYIDWTHYTSFTSDSLFFLAKNAGFEYITFRPSHQESAELHRLKQPWIDIYAAEFGLKNPILTPSFVAICFRSEKAFQDYCSRAPDLMSFDISKGKVRFDFAKLKIFKYIKNFLR